MMKTKITGVRIPSELRERIEEIAAKEEVTLSKQITRLLRAQVEGRQHKSLVAA